MEPQLDLGEVNGQKVYLNLAASLRQRVGLAKPTPARPSSKVGNLSSGYCGLRLVANKITKSSEVDMDPYAMASLQVIGSSC